MTINTEQIRRFSQTPAPETINTLPAPWPRLPEIAEKANTDFLIRLALEGSDQKRNEKVGAAVKDFLSRFEQAI